MDYKDQVHWLMHGDCLERMKEIHNNSVELILADPPYGTTACKWDTVIPLGKMWERLENLCKNHSAVILTAQSPFDKVLGASNLKMLRYEWTWEKHKQLVTSTQKEH